MLAMTAVISLQKETSLFLECGRQVHTPFNREVPFLLKAEECCLLRLTKTKERTPKCPLHQITYPDNATASSNSSSLNKIHTRELHRHAQRHGIQKRS